MQKVYLAVVRGVPKETRWTCRLKLGPDAKHHGKMRMDPRGKEAETEFHLIQGTADRALVEALPYTGRTHQIRVHLAEVGLPVLGDELYGSAAREGLALRAVQLAYVDPFTHQRVLIRAPIDDFCRKYGFETPEL